MATLVLPDAEFPIEACGLDVDGVLRNTGVDIYGATCTTIRELGGTPPSYEQFLATQGGDFVSRTKEWGIPQATRDEIYTLYQRHVPSHDVVAPFEDVAGFVSNLTVLQLKKFVVSGHPEEGLQAWFLEHNLHTHVEYVHGGSRDKAQHLRLACKHLGINPARACYIGDLKSDMEAAIEAGLVPIGITRGHHIGKVLYEGGAKCVVAHLSELSNFIR